MPRNLFTLLFGATFFVAIFMITLAQPNVGVNVLLPTRRPSIPTKRPSPPTKRPSIPTWRPNPPTRRPSPPTNRPTRRPISPTKRPTRRPSIPTFATRKPRSAKRPKPRPCSKTPKCSTTGPSLCVRSRSGKLCRRVANRCTLGKLNCRSKPRNNWIITPQQCCGKLKVGARAAKCIV
ncbi:zonadhesin-like [Zeugodacus cucurbitae]|uniref:zonadhesin-like n=1 Tax=Zeugodacus cucurbitae TaxID=28588 RepID=UPI0023D9023A|nr:zonadhesin-like [Zeugodacus cucurbitae]